MEYFGIRKYIILIIVFLFVLVFVTECEAQDINYSVYNNGKDISIGEERILFIYGNEAFGFKDGGFQAITVTGDTLEIVIKMNMKMEGEPNE